MTPTKVLVSACLLGKPVRYNGSAKALEDALPDRWINEGRVASVCPEIMAGLPTPDLRRKLQMGIAELSYFSGTAASWKRMATT